MLPPGHIEFTWATLNLLQRHLGLFEEADYRLAALAAVLPDLIDKPLATFVLTDAEAALLYGHTALLHSGVWLTAAAAGQLERSLPYLLAFSGHLLADRMWSFSQTLLWPLRGRRFHRWKHVGSPEAILRAYVKVIRDEPLLLTFEAIGALLLVWLILDRDLWQREELAAFVKTGTFGEQKTVNSA
ncbi:MAG: metal-dependent hydrolase [Anaerolineae bacterium]